MRPWKLPLTGVFVLSIAAYPSYAEAQSGRGIALEVFGGSAAREIVAPSGERSTGGFVGIDVKVPVSRLFLNARYIEGRLTPDAGSQSDYVEALLALGVRVAGPVSLRVGRRLRVFAVPGLRERWGLWEVRGDASIELFRMGPTGLMAQTYAEGWTALTGDVNILGDFGSSLGVEAGMLLRGATSPFRFRIGYRVERGQLAGGIRDESLESLTVGVCFCK